MAFEFENKHVGKLLLVSESRTANVRRRSRNWGWCFLCFRFLFRRLKTIDDEVETVSKGENGRSSIVWCNRAQHKLNSGTWGGLSCWISGLIVVWRNQKSVPGKTPDTHWRGWILCWTRPTDWPKCRVEKPDIKSRKENHSIRRNCHQMTRIARSVEKCRHPLLAFFRRSKLWTMAKTRERMHQCKCTCINENPSDPKPLLR